MFLLDPLLLVFSFLPLLRFSPFFLFYSIASVFIKPPCPVKRHALSLHQRFTPRLLAPRFSYPLHLPGVPIGAMAPVKTHHPFFAAREHQNPPLCSFFRASLPNLQGFRLKCLKRSAPSTLPPPPQFPYHPFKTSPTQIWSALILMQK